MRILVFTAVLLTLVCCPTARAALVASDCRDRVKSAINSVPNFPTTGQSPTILDDRIILAICTALQAWITGTGTVLPGTLNNPSGQAVAVTPATGIGSTSAPQVIQGVGTIQ